MKLKETIRPCVCCKDVDNDHGMYTGMPALIPTRNDEPEKFPQIYWETKCPKCGRGGILQYKSVHAALRSWNESQDRLWQNMDGFDIPMFYPIEEQDVCEPLYQRYHELIREIGYGYLLGMKAEDKKPLFEHMGLKEKMELLEGVLRKKKAEEEEIKRMWAFLDDETEEPE